MIFLRSLFRMRDQLQAGCGDTGAQEMSFLEHLEDLRRTLIRMSLALLAAMLLCFCFTPTMLELLRRPVESVWQAHEGKHLPAEVEAEAWVRAKELAEARGALGEEARRLLESYFPEQERTLADALPLLRAAALLPESERASYIRRAAGGEAVREVALRLSESGADLESGRGSAAPQMMGAFQPGEAFMLSLQLAFYGGAVVASPLLLFFLLQFVMPGLLENERRVILRSLWWGVGLFLLGCVFSYSIVLPRVLAFFFEYSWNMGISNDWRIGYYITFAAKLVFVFGIIFELPVVVIPLIKLGLLTHARMRRLRPYALVGSFAAALFLAPAPDPGTMLLMAMPLYLLYELCVLVAWREGRRSRAA